MTFEELDAINDRAREIKKLTRRITQWSEPTLTLPQLLHASDECDPNTRECIIDPVDVAAFREATLSKLKARLQQAEAEFAALPSAGRCVSP